MKSNVAQSAFLVVLIICGGLALFDFLLGGDPSGVNAETGTAGDLSMWIDHISERPLNADDIAAGQAAENTPAPEPGDASSESTEPERDAQTEAPEPAPAITRPAPAPRAVIVRSGASRVRQGIGQIVADMTHLEVALLLGPPQKSESSDRWVYWAINQRPPARDIYVIDFIDGEVRGVASLRYVPARPQRQ